MIDELKGQTLYDGLPAGRDGFVARMGVRAQHVEGAAADASLREAGNSADAVIGAALHDEHAEHVRRRLQRDDLIDTSTDDAP